MKINTEVLVYWERCFFNNISAFTLLLNPYSRNLSLNSCIIHSLNSGVIRIYDHSGFSNNSLYILIEDCLFINLYLAEGDVITVYNIRGDLTTTNVFVFNISYKNPNLFDNGIVYFEKSQVTWIKILYIERV